MSDTIIVKIVEVEKIKVLIQESENIVFKTELEQGIA
jgi:hypothetical protein